MTVVAHSMPGAVDQLAAIEALGEAGGKLAIDTLFALATTSNNTAAKVGAIKAVGRATRG